MPDKQKHPMDLVGDDPFEALSDLVAVVEMDDSYNMPSGKPDDDSYAVLFTAREANSKVHKRGKTAVLARLLLEQSDFKVPLRVEEAIRQYAYKD